MLQTTMRSLFYIKRGIIPMKKRTFQEQIAEEGNKVIQLHISDNVKKIVKQSNCKHEWEIIESSDYTETHRCNKCDKYIHL